ncbi:MAG: hypothetical protein ABSB76_20375 [Streptosporangiaceae bacterium]
MPPKDSHGGSPAGKHALTRPWPVWTYPDADVYALFADVGVRYVGSGPVPNQHRDGNLPTALMRSAAMPGFELPAIQISRRSNHRNAETDSALQKLLRVLESAASPVPIGG